jgi:hypothetical protein
MECAWAEFTSKTGSYTRNDSRRPAMDCLPSGDEALSYLSARCSPNPWAAYRLLLVFAGIRNQGGHYDGLAI